MSKTEEDGSAPGFWPTGADGRVGPASRLPGRIKEGFALGIEVTKIVFKLQSWEGERLLSEAEFENLELARAVASNIIPEAGISLRIMDTDREYREVYPPNVRDLCNFERL